MCEYLRTHLEFLRIVLFPHTLSKQYSQNLTFLRSPRAPPGTQYTVCTGNRYDVGGTEHVTLQTVRVHSVQYVPEMGIISGNRARDTTNCTQCTLCTGNSHDVVGN